MSKHKFKITGIDCANCAAHLERQLKKINGLENVQINFMGEKLTFECDDDKYDELMVEVKKCIDKNEPDAVLGKDELLNATVKKDGSECSCGHEHHEHAESCSCGQDHSHEHNHDHSEDCSFSQTKVNAHKFKITGIDCANCAAHLERQLKKISGLENVQINFMGEKLTFECDDDKYDELMTEVKKCIEKNEPDAVLGNDELLKATVKKDDSECSCGHDHDHVHHHEHGESCSCGHDHDHEHHHDHSEDCSFSQTKVNAHKFKITGIDCANCAAHLERQLKKINGLENVQINFMGEKLTFECDDDKYDELMAEVKKCIDKNEPDAVLGNDELLNATVKKDGGECSFGHEHHEHEHHHEQGESCSCGHDHGHEHDHEHAESCSCGQDHSHEHNHDHEHIDESNKAHTGNCKYTISGLDCANCAAELEREIAKLDCVDNVTITFMNETLSFNVISGTERKAVEKIKSVIDKKEPGCTLTPKAKEVAKPKKPEHKKEKTQIVASIILLIIAVCLEKLTSVAFPVYALFYMASYFIVGWDVLKSAFRNLGKGQWMDEKFLMAIATVGAIGTLELTEGVFVMLLYQIGELFQAMAVESTRRSISDLMDIKADTANVKFGDSVRTVPVEKVSVNDIIVVRPGEKIPLDAVVIGGESSVNTSALTGESLPRDVSIGDSIVSGTVNIQGLLEAKVTKNSTESTVSKILDLVENSSSRKATTENFISTFAKYYTPIVVYLALIVAFIVPGIVSVISHTPYLTLLPDYFHRGLMFLVVSCPCAIVISVPLTYFSGIGSLSKKGILVKGSNYLDALNEVDTVVFDKTGTITKGRFSITNIVTDYDKDELVKLAAHAEYNSTHPIGKAIVRAYGAENINAAAISDVVELAGHGVEVLIEGKKVLAGNEKLMKRHNIPVNEIDEIGTIVHIAVDGKYTGYIVVADEVKESSAAAMSELKANGIKNTVMITGDSEKIAESIAKKVGITKVFANMLPQDKVSEFSKLNETNVCAYVGDGINDAPVLAMSKVGIAMGGLGSDAAIEASDIVIMNDDLMSVAQTVKGAKKTRQIVMHNIVFSLAVKFAILAASAFGITDNMMIAIFGDVGVMLIAVLNAIRALK